VPGSPDSPSDSPAGLDDALDELYGVAPAEFMAARKDLGDRLRAAGHTDAAKELARVRRPTTAAWALNRLAREHVDLVDEVVEQTRALEVAQADARPGEAADVRGAMTARREALRVAADAAVAIAARVTDKPENHREAIVAALEAAGLDQNRFGVTFPASSRKSDAKTAPRRRPAAKPASRPSDEDDRMRRAEGERVAARADLEAAEAAADAAVARADAGSTAADAAGARVAEAERAVDRAKAELEAAKREARTARADAQALRRASDAAAKVAETARRRLANLGG
jgi:hypothetical protein